MYEIISPNVSLILPLALEAEDAGVFSVKLHARGVIEIDTDFFVSDRVAELFDEYKDHGHLYPVSVTGLKLGSEFHREGSVRFCAWDGNFAEALTEMIQAAEVPELYSDGHNLWQFAEVSKYFRFMRYSNGGEHFPHYDSDFGVGHMRHRPGFGQVQDDIYTTKYSLVMYFNDCDSGEVAFIDHDGKDKSDWSRQATDSEIYLKIMPKAGKIVLFPHDVCHTVLPYTDGAYRYIVRGDLIFTKVHP